MDIIQNMRRQRERQKARQAQLNAAEINVAASSSSSSSPAVSAPSPPPPVPQPSQQQELPQPPQLPPVPKPAHQDQIRQPPQPPPLPQPTPQSSAKKQIQRMPSLKKQKKFVVNGKEYLFECELGRGGSSKVYEAKRNNNVYAIKVVDLENVEPRVYKGYMDEVKLLEQLQGKEGIIQLEEHELRIDENGKELLVVMEKGENDFQTFLRSADRSPNLIRYYWEQMLKCVNSIHAENIVHSDLKPANFIFVKNKLKLIDFGISSRISVDVTSIAKETQAGTLNYMSPETIETQHDNKYHIPLKSDIWSLGCILYSMVYGAAPFAHITHQIKKMQAICSERINFNPVEDRYLLDVMQLCLKRNYKERPSAEDLLKHPYLNPITVQNEISSFFTPGHSATMASTLYDTVEVDPIVTTQIEDEVRKNTPRTAARNISRLFQKGSTTASFNSLSSGTK